MTATATETIIYVGACPACRMGVALEGRGGVTNCPECNARVKVERVEGHYSESHLCNADCEYAVGRICVCGCGGKNHGMGWSAQRRVFVPERITAKIVKRRERLNAAKAEKVAQARRSAEDKVSDLVDEYPLLAWLTYLEALDGNYFLESVARQMEEKGDLSARQIEAAVGAIVRDTERREREERREAERVVKAAEGRFIGQEKARVIVKGKVTVVKVTKSQFGSSLLIAVEGVEEHEGVTVKTFTTSAPVWDMDLKVGEVVTISGTVKKHETYNGIPQTMLTRVAVSR